MPPVQISLAVLVRLEKGRVTHTSHPPCRKGRKLSAVLTTHRYPAVSWVPYWKSIKKIRLVLAELTMSTKLKWFERFSNIVTKFGINSNNNSFLLVGSIFMERCNNFCTTSRFYWRKCERTWWFTCLTYSWSRATTCSHTPLPWCLHSPLYFLATNDMHKQVLVITRPFLLII